jgi:hypothetical protein
VAAEEAELGYLYDTNCLDRLKARGWSKNLLVSFFYSFDWQDLYIMSYWSSMPEGAIQLLLRSKFNGEYPVHESKVP